MNAEGKQRCLRRESLAFLSDTSLGFLIAGSGQLIATFDAMFVRLSTQSRAEIDGWIVIFWRFFLMTVMLVLSMLFVYKERFVGMAWNSLDRYGVAAALLMSSCQICYTWALQLMPAANTVVVFASCPMITAVLSWIVFKEPMPLRVAIIIVSSFLSVFCVFAGELKNAGVWGFVLAGGAAFAMAFYSMLCYHLSFKEPSRSMLPSLGLAGMVSAATGMTFARGNVSSGVTGVAFGCFFAQGIVVPLWYSCISISTTFITATEANMVVLLDPILAPFWVWLSGFEAPPKFAVAGGCALAVCLMLHGRWSAQAEMHKTASSPSSIAEPLLAA